MAEVYKSLNPLKYYRDYYSHDIRPDGREFSDIRPTIINVGSIKTADGSAIVKIGKTCVTCGVKAELCQPKPSMPDQGFLVPNVELPPLCYSKFKSGPPSDQAQTLTQLLADIIENSKCVNLEDLCILSDKLCWCLYADLICINYDGSIVDACLIALIACLKSVTLPQIDYNPALEVKQVNLQIRRPLKVNFTPVAVTFAIFDDKIILSDPTVEEENFCTGTLTVVVNGDELCCVHKPGGSPLIESELEYCIEKSKIRAIAINELIAITVKDSNSENTCF